MPGNRLGESGLRLSTLSFVLTHLVFLDQWPHPLHPFMWGLRFSIRKWGIYLRNTHLFGIIQGSVSLWPQVLKLLSVAKVHFLCGSHYCHVEAFSKTSSVHRSARILWGKNDPPVLADNYSSLALSCLCLLWAHNRVILEYLVAWEERWVKDLHVLCFSVVDSTLPQQPRGQW